MDTVRPCQRRELWKSHKQQSNTYNSSNLGQIQHLICTQNDLRCPGIVQATLLLLSCDTYRSWEILGIKAFKQSEHCSTGHCPALLNMIQHLREGEGYRQE